MFCLASIKFIFFKSSSSFSASLSGYIERRMSWRKKIKKMYNLLLYCEEDWEFNHVRIRFMTFDTIFEFYKKLKFRIFPLILTRHTLRLSWARSLRLPSVVNVFSCRLLLLELRWLPPHVFDCGFCFSGGITFYLMLVIDCEKLIYIGAYLRRRLADAWMEHWENENWCKMFWCNFQEGGKRLPKHDRAFIEFESNRCVSPQKCIYTTKECGLRRYMIYEIQ